MNTDTGKAFVLLSGGADSSTCLYVAHQDGYSRERIIGMSVAYGQLHEEREIRAAKAVCDYMGVAHRVVPINMPKGGLTDPQVDIPDATYAQLPEGVSPSFVPFRNGLFIATLAGIAQAEGGAGSMVYHGAHSEDAAGDAYPDCTLEFIGAMAAAVERGTYGQVRLRAPFIQSLKSEIIACGDALGVPYALTYSCYRGHEEHCGKCPTCYARKMAFAQAGVPDPTIYEGE